MNPHRCYAPECTLEISQGMLMCRNHWRQVPRPVRDRVLATWRRIQGGGGVAEVRAYRTAINDARDALQPEVPA